MKKLALVIACASAFALPAAEANAQQEREDGDTDRDAETRSLDTIVVTAQRREENIQKTAVSITAVDGEQIRERGLSNISDVLSQTPSVQVEGSNVAKMQSVFIRGVGSTGDPHEGGDPAVNLSIDGVYQQQVRFAGTLDLQRVEVLRGPQGTLYGRNANAGSVNVITKDPEIGSFSGNAQVQLGNYETVRTEAAANLPISDALAARVAYGTAKRDGYLENGANAEDSTAARVKFLYQPSDALTLRVTADHSRETGTPAATVPLPLSSEAPWRSHVLSGVKDEEASRIYAQLDYDLGFATLTALPAYSETHFYWDSMMLPIFSYAQGNSEYSQSAELRLVSAAESAVKWVGGLYYYKGRVEHDLNPPEVVDFVHYRHAIGADAISVARAESYAVYGQANFPLSDRLRAVGGARYTVDRKTSEFMTATGETSAGETTFAPGPSYSGRWSASTWKAGLEYDVGADSFLYGQVSTGLKAGGINGIDGSTYDPETIIAYEIGSKNRFLDNRLQLNGSAFYYDYEDFQANLPFHDPENLDYLNKKTQNAVTASIYGAELEVNWMPTTSNRLDLSLAYLRARFDDFVYTDSSGQVDRSGQTMPRSPTWSGQLSYSRFWDLASGASLTGRLDVRYSSSYDAGIDEAPGGLDIQSSYTRSDASLIYRSASGNWGLRLYVRNIEDKAQFLFTLVPVPVLAAGEVSDPRTYGIALNLNF